MKISDYLIDKIKNKAKQSTCRYKVAAMGFSRKGDFVGCTMNTHRFSRLGGGNHAELNLIKKYGKKLKTIVICRIGSEDLLPISPCKVCFNVANNLGIKIITINK